MISKIADVMTTKVITVSKGIPVVDVVKLMSDHGISCIVIVNSASQPVGIVTERDMVRRVLRNAMDPRQVLIDDVMSSPVMTISPERKITDAINLMQKYHFRRVVVADENSKLVGILTQSDLMTEVQKVQLELERMNESLRNTITSLKRYSKIGTETSRIKDLKEKVSRLEKSLDDLKRQAGIKKKA